MIYINIVSFCISILIIAETFLRKSDFFSPIRIYLFFHSLTLGISFLCLNRAMTPFNSFTSLVYFGSASSFVLGAFVFSVIFKRFSGKTVLRPLNKEKYSWNTHFIFASIIFLTFILGVSLAVFLNGGFPLFAKDKAIAIRIFFGTNLYISVGILNSGVSMALFFIYAFRPKSRRRFLNLGVLMTILTGVILFFALSRSQFVFFAFFAIVFYSYSVKGISIPKLFFLFVTFFTIFMVTAYLKLSNFEKQKQLDVNTFQFITALLKVPYVYVANNFWNLDYALNPENFQERHPTTYGFTTLSGIIDMITLPGGSLGQGIRESSGFDDQFNVQSIKVKGLNTMGYQWGLYKDFGIIGVIIFPFLFGLLIQILYLKVRFRPTIFNISAYSYLAYFIGFSWFLAFWESTVQLYGFFYICCCCYFSQIPSASILGAETKGPSLNLNA